MKRLSKLHSQAEQAMKEAIKEVVEQHRKTGRPISVWKNDKVTMIPAVKTSYKNGR